MRGNLTVIIERDDPGGVDEYGDPVVGTVTTHDIEGCAVAPRTDTGELEVRGRAGVIVSLTLFAPSGADIARTDRVVIAAGDPNDGTYEVEGRPGEWWFSDSSPGGVQVALRRAEG